MVGTVQAEKAADAVLNWETGAEYDGGGPSPTSEEEAANSPKGSGAACIIVEVRLGPVSPSCCWSFNVSRRTSGLSPGHQNSSLMTTRELLDTLLSQRSVS